MKRSFNSISSNPSGNSGSKKKKTNQKTLGMAWGSNSRSSSRSSSRNSPFSDFGSYMVAKNRKLQDQFDAEASSSSHSVSNCGKQIFQGVSIFVDGYTIPSSQELRDYMLKYGGHFENYFSRHRVTHIICSNLPDSKIKNLRSFSGGLPVVKPTWVLDSIVANKLLSCVPYQLVQVASETHHQPKLSAFFAFKTPTIFSDATTCVTDLEKPGVGDSLLNDGTMKNYNYSEDDESSGRTERCVGESDGHMVQNKQLMIGDAESNGYHNEVKMAESHDACIAEEVTEEIEPHFSACQPAASVSSECFDNQSNMKSKSSIIVGSSSRCHSTLTDPNFVENYFKYSRLHFIGTWRNRYRRRFPYPSIGFKHTNLDASSAASQKTTIIHVDMDCFFVSVVIKNSPELWDKPVAVCHSDNPHGTAEISSANYPARDHGVKAGMFVRDAKALCPHLLIFTYDFEAYEEVADQFYCILHKCCNKVQAVSCDEAFLAVSDSEVEDPQLLASDVRKKIFDATKCTASAGIAGNMLMACLATRSAKPNGQFYIPPEKVDDYLHELPIKALPGIGHVLEEKLKRRQVRTCGQLRMASKESLQKDFGTKTGDMLWNYSRGIDNRLVGVIQESKSIGAEVNWGVRFNELKDCQHFLASLCKEVSLRLQGCGVQGRTFTLKIKKRRNDAHEPVKYMGCGDCENLSHSITVPMVTDDVNVLQRISARLFAHFHIDVKDIRGIGLQVSKLQTADTRFERNSIISWLVPDSESARGQSRNSGHAKETANREKVGSDSAGPSVQVGLNSNSDSTLPPISDLDTGVIESLPPDVFSEINDMYDGKLLNLISKTKGVEKVNKEHLLFHLNPSDRAAVIKEEMSTNSVERTSKVVAFTSVYGKFDVMPSSLSQVDVSVLQQLPEDLRVDILECLPSHRRPACTSDAFLFSAKSNPQESNSVKNTEDSRDSDPCNELWVGSPPRWVHEFKVSKCWILNMLAEIYYRSGPASHLSSILQKTISETQLLRETTEGLTDAISCLCELVKQYIRVKIATDIEEVYVCICLLRRLSMKSKIFLHVYNIILPLLQASVGDNYGGNFNISSVNN